MRIKYVGHGSVAVRLPVGARRKDTKEIVQFKTGQVHDFSEEDGTKLLELNKATDHWVTEEPGLPKIEEVPTDEPKKKRGRPRKVDISEE